MLSGVNLWIVRMACGTLFFCLGRVSGHLRPERRLMHLMTKRRKKKNADSKKTVDSNSSNIAYTKAIYDKMLTLFETHKPYLDPDLTINDVAKRLLTNKIYVAKAIKVFAGTNFSQFVNTYRIKYSIALFMEDTSLRVGEMAFKSGFNTTAAFNIAFKVNMNMTPGEWCRRYRLKQL